MIGGGTVPLFVLPKIVQKIASISPFKWADQAIEGAIWRGFSLQDMLLPVGVLIAMGGLKVHPNDPGKVDPFHWKPIFWVLASIVVFGLVLKIVGMLIAGLFLVIGASFGSHDFRLKPVLILGIALVIFCALVFVWGLKLPIPLCPDVESLQQVGMCRG